MKTFSALLLAFWATTGALAAPAAVPEAAAAPEAAAEPGLEEFTSPNPLAKRGGTANGSGWNNNYYYQFWSTQQAYVLYSNGANGEYNVKWSGNGDFTAGKGWNPGSARTINFSGTYYPGDSGSLSVYGWTTNPLVEYYVMENYAGNPASGLTYVGSVYSDGANYNIYKHTQYNQPSIQGTATFTQYINIRQSKRSSGAVNMGTHFNAWKSHGMSLGTHNYQIVSTEAWSGNGAADITVW